MLSRPPGRGGVPARGHEGLPWIGTGLILLLLIAAIIWAVRATTSASRLDARTLCEESGPSAVTTLLIDATDSISPLQRLAVSNRLAAHLKRLRRNERLDIFTIRPGADPLTPVFSMCRPVTGAETSELTGNKARADRRFNETFKPALDQALAALLTQESADRSPIMESIQAASVRSLQSPDLRGDAQGFRKRLIVVSDLLQHSELGSQLREVPSWDAFRGSAAMRGAASDLSGTDVWILYLHRDGSPVQGQNHARFWDTWFAEQGAVVQSALPIEG